MLIVGSLDAVIGRIETSCVGTSLVAVCSVFVSVFVTGLAGLMLQRLGETQVKEGLFICVCRGGAFVVTTATFPETVSTKAPSSSREMSIGGELERE